jgi:Tfp pilus assembly protein PilZ
MSTPPGSVSSPAVDYEEPVFLEVDISAGSESCFFVDLTGDVGHAGIFVATWREIPIGRAVVIASFLPDGRIVVTGRARWARDAGSESGPGVGVALDRLSDRDVARIARFCDERPPYYYDVEAA